MRNDADPSAITHAYQITASGHSTTPDHLVRVTEFQQGDNRWQIQVYNEEGSLVIADYFPTETDALRWAVSEALDLASHKDQKA